MDARLQISDFETDLLGVPVGKLVVRGNGDGKDAADRLARLAAGWSERRTWLVSCRVPVASPLIGALEGVGFQTIETLVTFRHDLADAPAAADVEPARPDDTDACVAIAKRAFIHDRLHRDPRVPDAAADLIREAWVRNDLGGRADASLVVRADGAVVGMNLCLLDRDEAVIDLIAVDVGHQGQGLGRKLVEGALARYRGRARTMRVGTQADNTASIKLYQGTGFVEADRQITLHWINRDGAPSMTEGNR
jgi:ribosomal protein S18 acetylase RimI-like enzyme